MGACGSHNIQKEPVHKLIATCLDANRGEFKDVVDCSDIMLCCYPTGRSSRYSAKSDDAAVQQKIAARIIKIKQLSEDCHMEKKFLKQNKNVPIGRSSSPKRDQCYHCEHSHRQKCCLYPGDSSDDLQMYPRWKDYLEQTTIAPGDYSFLPEAVSAGSTPNWFPTNTLINSAIYQLSVIFRSSSEPKRHSSSIDRSPSPVFYHLTVLHELDNDLDVLPEQRPTPYQLYMQQQFENKQPHVIVWLPPKRQSTELKLEYPLGSLVKSLPPPVHRSRKPKQKEQQTAKPPRRIC